MVACSRGHEDKMLAHAHQQATIVTNEMVQIVLKFY